MGDDGGGNLGSSAIKLQKLIESKYHNDQKLRNASEAVIRVKMELEAAVATLNAQISEAKTEMWNKRMVLSEEFDMLAKEKIHLELENFYKKIRIKKLQFMSGIRATIEKKARKMLPEWLQMINLSLGHKFFIALSLEVSMFAVDLKNRVAAAGVSLSIFGEYIDKLFEKYPSKIHDVKITEEMTEKEWTEFFRQLGVGRKLEQKTIRILIEPYAYTRAKGKVGQLPHNLDHECSKVVCYLDNVKYQATPNQIEAALRNRGITTFSIIDLKRRGNRNLFTKKVFLSVKKEDSDRLPVILNDTEVAAEISLPEKQVIVVWLGI